MNKGYTCLLNMSKVLCKITEYKKNLRNSTERKKSLHMITEYEPKLYMFTYYKQVYVCLLSIRKG